MGAGAAVWGQERYLLGGLHGASAAPYIVIFVFFRVRPLISLYPACESWLQLCGERRKRRAL